ncbi:MAG TPA: GNAT family protein [Aromatoleum sp.]|uniref:GNAT family N-acetyltransferase n=1 Tax=Aromatoleum sp. TaxID=2307007 RepID=UPI002B465E1A|nr:GNAT family protein [Aromatoleum sp.]HJV24373.1 GNAT family protein [Aromatoleum sp.]
MAWIEPVVLAGECAILTPLSLAHAPDLREAVVDGELWRLWYTFVPPPEQMTAEIERRLALQEAGSMLPFAVVSKETGRAVGMTTFMHIEAQHRRLEIGSTWYRAGTQRTAINTECKRLMLTHAFEALSCIAVEFRTSAMNFQSRRAIERLGAKLDGVLRSHQIAPNGSLRDTHVYSILAHEWPAVRANLDWQLSRPRAQA